MVRVTAICVAWRKSRVMNLRRISVLILFFVFTNHFYAAEASVISGTGSMFKGGWDFSLQMTVDANVSDVFLASVFDPPLGLRVAAYMAPALVAEITDCTFEELKYAPEDSMIYDIDAPASVGRVYVSKTMEGHYAKFRFLILTYDEIIIEYLYQPDGSRVLYDTSEIKEYSWSRIKALFE